jgi:hypothetical protein
MGCICRSISEPFEFSVDAISHLQLPKAASLAVECVHICHFLGRALSRFELRQRHPGLYLAGVLTNAKFGDFVFLKVAAQIVHLAQVFFSIVEEGGMLVHSCNRLWKAIFPPKWIAVPYMENRLTREEWNLQEGRAPSVLFLPWPVAFIASNIMLVVMRIVEVVSHIWQLNLYLFDLYDAVWMNSRLQSEAIDDLFMNLHDIAGQFLSRERRLSQAVAAHGQWIDRLLKVMKVDWTAERLEAILNGFADQAEGIGTVCALHGQAMGEMVKGSSSIATALITNYSSEGQTYHQQKLRITSVV